MKNIKNVLLYTAILTILVAAFLHFRTRESEDDKFVSYRVDLKKVNLKMYWKDENGQPFRSLQNLKTSLASKGQTLAFAMNAGIFKSGNVPLGLFIERQRVVTPLDTASGTGNFYLKPNGVFYTAVDGNAGISTSENFIHSGVINYATQSGPMLVIDGQIHPSFTSGSKNVNVRNGVGILPNKQVLFAMSKKEINFYDFASYFKKMGCRNALYLDGFVSRTYLPEQNWAQMDGDFAVIIGTTKKPQ